jgi:HEAT repeat protein
MLERIALDEAIAPDQRRLLLVYAGAYGERAKTLLARLSTDRSAVLRAEAIRGIGRLSAVGSEGVTFLAACLDDPSAEVRSTAAQGLLRWHTVRRQPGTSGPWPTSDELARLLASPYPDVRILAVRLAVTLEPETRFGFLSDACLDDDTSVRCEAILHLAILGTPQALELAARSLDDPEPEVVLATARALAMRPSAQNRQLLDSFHSRCTDAAVKTSIASLLTAMNDRGPTPLRLPLSLPPGPVSGGRRTPSRPASPVPPRATP